MAGEPTITVVGNLTRDPQISFTKDGTSVANFTVASTPRTKVDGEWKDAETTFYSCSVWREYAENVIDSLTKGDRVIVHGRLRTRTYKDKNGADRLSVDIEVDEVGPVLRYATAKVTKVKRAGGRQSAPFDGDKPNDEPWSTVPSSGSAAADDDPPPF